MTMKIRMLTTENGSVDGIRVEVYSAGTEYDLSQCQGARDLAAAFVGARMAVEVAGDATPAPAPAPEVAAEVAPVEVVEPVAAPTPGKPGRKSKK
jgi:hypothetical protein